METSIIVFNRQKRNVEGATTIADDGGGSWFVDNCNSTKTSGCAYCVVSQMGGIFCLQVGKLKGLAELDNPSLSRNCPCVDSHFLLTIVHPILVVYISSCRNRTETPQSSPYSCPIPNTNKKGALKSSDNARNRSHKGRRNTLNLDIFPA